MMITLKIFQFSFKPYAVLLFFSMLLLLWWSAPLWVYRVDSTIGLVDQGIWYLIVLAILVFMLLLALCWWLLEHFLHTLGLPDIYAMVSQIKILSIWQQLVFYWASFALLLSTAIACLVAIC
ncbi:hypothetical protein [Pseudopedobacter beijingensis]|uniref:Uncharacterized protein n=1 Tax=Pseudopedobacter beijingensis TaxID=1207056 RepID=A0ABW4IEB6_9SPHI